MRRVNPASPPELLPGVSELSVLSCFSTKHKPLAALLLVGDERRNEHPGQQSWRHAPDLLKMARTNPLLQGLLPQPVGYAVASAAPRSAGSRVWKWLGSGGGESGLFYFWDCYGLRAHLVLHFLGGQRQCCFHFVLLGTQCPVLGSAHRRNSTRVYGLNNSIN